MPGPCGGPGDGTNEGTKDGKCTKEGKRHGKGEHADKWCCTGNKCREALGIIESAAAKQAAKQAAANDAAFAVDDAAVTPAAAAAAAEAAPEAALATSTGRGCLPSVEPRSAAHLAAWRKIMLGERGARVLTLLREQLTDEDQADLSGVEPTHEDWYDVYNNVYSGGDVGRGDTLVEVHEVTGISLDEDGLSVAVRGQFRKADGDKQLFLAETCMVRMTEYTNAAGTLAELTDFLATLSTLVPIHAQVEAAEAAATRDATHALQESIAAGDVSQMPLRFVKGTRAVLAARAAVAVDPSVRAAAERWTAALSPSNRKRPAQTSGGSVAQATAATAAVGSPASRKRPAEAPERAACRSSPRVRPGIGA